MIENILARLFEHNHWANLQLIQACSTLSDQQLDAEPQSATHGSIRLTLWHIVYGQQKFLSQLMGQDVNEQVPPTFVELLESATLSGEGLLALARDETSQSRLAQIQDEGYAIEPWVIMVQAINHATEHREQINSMLSALGLPALSLSGGAYGWAVKAIIPIST